MDFRSWEPWWEGGGADELRALLEREWSPIASASDDRYVHALGGDLFRHATAPALVKLLKGFRISLGVESDDAEDWRAAEAITDWFEHHGPRPSRRNGDA